MYQIMRNERKTGQNKVDEKLHTSEGSDGDDTHGKEPMYHIEIHDFLYSICPY